MSGSDNPIRSILTQMGISEESAHKFKFGGVVGKLTIVAVGGFAGTVGLAKYTSGTTQLICILASLVTTITCIRWILGYAEKHPVTATLEGAEIILWRQQVMVAKGGLTPPKDSPVIPDPQGSPPELNPPSGDEEQ